MTADAGWDSTYTWDDISPRQQDVLLCLARGRSNQRIAEELGISPATVRNYLAELYSLLGFDNRVEALRWVMAHEDVAAEVLASV